jgi:predicted patatin/cPLA2 family phospholipase
MITNLSTLSTRDLIAARRRSGSKPGGRDDGRVVALVIEGGAMRGVISAGMACALEQQGLRDCFDAVYGSSAGAIGAAYFVAGQAQYGVTIFYENINNRKFVDLKRLLVGRPVVSLEYLLDDVCSHQKPLRFERVLESDIPLRVLAASLQQQRAVVLGDFIDKADLLDALRASARIPYFAGAPVSYRGDRFIDASLYVSIPFAAAINDQATDLVVLLTRPLGSFRRNPGWIVRRLTALHLKRLDPALWQHYLARPQTYRAEIETIRRHSDGMSLPRMLLIHPPEGVARIGPFEMSASKLQAAAQAGFASACAALASGGLAP